MRGECGDGNNSDEDEVPKEGELGGEEVGVIGSLLEGPWWQW